MLKTIKRVLLPVICILVLCLLAGCGATIDTELTVDASFAGTRTINVQLDNDDLGYVTGGVEAMQAVADAALPEQLTYTTTSDDSGVTMQFQMSFTDLENYKEQVTALLAAGGETEMVPEIIYDNQQTEFKMGVSLQENFDSFDLLRWYFNALQTAAIITHETTSEWYELGSNTVFVNNQEYSSYSDDISINEKESYCLSNIQVQTVLNQNGTYDRTFLFEAYESTVQDLQENGLELGAFLKALTPANGTFEESVDSSWYEYTISVTGVSAEELVQITNTVLKTENAFQVDMTLDPQTVGVANVAVQEALDGSYYLEYSYGSSLRSTIRVFDNCTLADDAAFEGSYYDGELSYYPNLEQQYSYNFSWKIAFSGAQLELDAINGEKAKISMIFTIDENLPQDIKDFAMAALELRCGEQASFARSDDVATVSATGNEEELSQILNSFYNYGLPEEEQRQPFVVKILEAETSSAFTKQYLLGLQYELSGLIGQNPVTVEDREGTLDSCSYQGSFRTLEDGSEVLYADSEVTAVVSKISWVTVILTAVFVLMFLAGAVLVITQIKQIAALVAVMKEKVQQKKEAAAAAAAAAQAAQPVYQPVYQPAAEQPADEQPAAPVAQEPAVEEAPAAEEEEEELL